MRTVCRYTNAFEFNTFLTQKSNKDSEIETISLNRFREHVEKVSSKHELLRVTRRNVDDFIVIGMDDWEQHEETMYILQNNNLMSQISRSMETHVSGKGYKPSLEEMDAI